jgi:predicted ATPase
MAETDLIRTPDQRVRVFISSSLGELAAERRAARDAVRRLRLVPVMFELGARPHPPRPVYRAYLAQSDVFVGIYWQSYGWVAPGEQISGLEDEYRLSASLPRLIYVRMPAADREPRLTKLLARIRDADEVSYQYFSEPAELRRLVEDDLAVLLSERFEMSQPHEYAAAALAGTLPVPATPLLGREQEAAAIEDLVVKEGVRLVTLTGPGGVGKSRLMVEAARRLGPCFADGPSFVDLAAVSAADLVAAAIASGLGLNTSAGRLIADLESYLRARRLLLALDNFEQVMDAAALVTQLLAAAAGVTVLVTSRTALRLRPEHEFPVPALPVPPAGANADPAGMLRYAAVGLFAERAHAADPAFELTAGNAAAVAEVCRRLDGLPLAIELAAARTRLLPPQALLSRLDERFSLLTGGARDMPERQRTLKNTLDWSFGLLPPGEQALFARLGVFAGSFGLPAAEAVGGDSAQVIDPLGALVDCSLVRPQTASGEPRFSLLETMREYALGRLREGQDWAQAHDRHAAYYLALGEPADADLTGPGRLTWLERLETEHDNLWAAMSWLVDHGPLEHAVHLFLVTWRFWWLRGHAAECVRLADRMAADSGDLPAYEHALALTGAGFTLIANEDQIRARQVFEQSLPLYRQASEQKLGVALNATVLAVLGHLAASRRDYDGAGHLLDEGRAVLGRLGDDNLTGYDRLQYLLTAALLDNFLGQVRLGQHDHDGAARLFADGLAEGRRSQDAIVLLVSLYDLGLARQAQGDPAGAEGPLKEGLALAADTGDETSANYYLEALAAVAGQRDDPEGAVRLLAAARSLLETKGSGWLHAYVTRVAPGDADLAGWRSRLGEEAFEQAQAWGRSAGSRRAVEYALG